jgi:uncharacterized membrane protein YhaH (DUF805 family)
MINFFELYGTWKGRIGPLVHFAGVAPFFVLHLIAAFVLSEQAQVLLFLATFYPSWMLTVKRAHDFGHSAWWVVRWTLLSLVAGAIVGVGVEFFPALLLGVPLAALSAWHVIIKLLFVQGDIGPNQFGPPSRLGTDFFSEETTSARPSAAPMSGPTARLAAMSNATQAAHTTPRAPRNSSPTKPRPAGFGRRTTA